MPDFDPNEYLKKQSQSKGFDPSKYLEENPVEKKKSCSIRFYDWYTAFTDWLKAFPSPSKY